MTEYVEKQEDWMAPNGWGQRLSVQGVRYQTVCSRRQDAPEQFEGSHARTGAVGQIRPVSTVLIGDPRHGR